MMRVALLLSALACAHSLVSPAGLAPRTGATAFAPTAKLSAASVADPAVHRSRIARAVGSGRRARIHATATDLPAAAVSQSEADAKLVKYVNDRGGKRVCAHARSIARGRACSRGTR